MQREKVLELVYNSIEVINGLRGKAKPRLELKEDTRLLGKDSKLDSLGLVNLVVEIEQRLSNEYGMEVSLMTDEAISQEKDHLSTVRSLSDYIWGLSQRRENG